MKFFVAALCVVLLPLVACRKANPPSPEFAGSWVLKTRGQNLMILLLRLDGSQVRGALKRPSHFQMDPDGGFENISADHVEQEILKGEPAGEQLRISVKGSEGIASYVVTLVDADHVVLRPADMPDWLAPMQFERAQKSASLEVSDDWSEPKPSPEIAALRARLKEMVAEDQEVRNERPISSKKLRDVARQDLPTILRMYKTFGWPKQSEVGKEAAGAFWLLVQHQDLDFQQKLLPDMERAMREGEASRQNYAYLYDRVMKGQRKPQRWGTQTSCVDGKAVLDPVEDLSKS